MTVHLLEGDALQVLADLPEASVDSVVTDPPYELGFMGKKWDTSGIAYNVELWREVLRVLKPGGHLLAFGGTRTYHRMTCAIEDAGFEIRDSLHWVYGQGFPKSLNIGDGRGTALKPAHEPIVMARKPLVGTVAANVLEHGTGALNIDACRIGTDPIPTHAKKGMHGAGSAEKMRAQGFRPYEFDNREVPESLHAGRWPANILFDEDAAKELDAQSGPGAPSARANKGLRHAGRHGGLADQGANLAPNTDGPRGYIDSGGASRFFYVAKPSRKERGQGNTHPTVKPVELMRYLVRLVTPLGGTVLDPFMGSGTTGIAAQLEDFSFIGIEREAAYVDIAKQRIGSTIPSPQQQVLL